MRYLEDVAAASAVEGASGNSGVRVLLDSHARVFQCLWGAQAHLERGAHGVWRNSITGYARARRGSIGGGGVRV